MTTTNGACPCVGVASAVAHAVPTGPSRLPRTVLTCAAFAPSPANPSPSSKGLGPSVTDLLQQVGRHRVGLGVVTEKRDVARCAALDSGDPVQRVPALEQHDGAGAHRLD